MTLRSGAIALALLASTVSSAFCEDAPESVIAKEATDNLPDQEKTVADPVPEKRPDDSKLAESIDSGYEGG